MNSKISKILSIVTGIIGLVALYFLMMIIMEGDDTVKESVDLQNSLVSPYISFAKIVLYITTILAVGFSILNLVKNPQLLKKSLISLVALGILLAFAYGMADDGETLNAAGNVIEDGEAGTISKWVSTGIWYSVILGGVGIFIIFGGFIKSIVSK
jgi:Na+/H+ antiporter NhaD/arsenite permease-like protein